MVAIVLRFAAVSGSCSSFVCSVVRRLMFVGCCALRDARCSFSLLVVGCRLMCFVRCLGACCSLWLA